MLTTEELRTATSLPAVSRGDEFDAWREGFLAIVNKSEQPLIPCYLVILNIRNILSSESVPLIWLTTDYVLGILLPIITTLYRILTSNKVGDESVDLVLKNISSARVHLNTALAFYERDEVYDGLTHLSLAEVELVKALEYFYYIRREIGQQYPELILD